MLVLALSPIGLVACDARERDGGSTAVSLEVACDGARDVVAQLMTDLAARPETEGGIESTQKNLENAARQLREVRTDSSLDASFAKLADSIDAFATAVVDGGSQGGLDAATSQLVQAVGTLNKDCDGAVLGTGQ